MKKIRIGNQTAFSAATPEEPFEYAVANGFDTFEWFPDRNESGEGWDISEIDTQARSHIRDRASKHDITLAVHASLLANPLEIETHGIIMKDIKFSQDIGAALMNMHLSVHCGIDDYIEAIMPVIGQIEKAGMKISIENTPLTTPEDFNRLFSVLQDMKMVKKGNVGMCLDVGHANLCNATHNDYLSFIDRLGDQVPIIHVHMHENYGDEDTHLPLFSGPAGTNSAGIRGLMKRLKNRNFSGSIILEQWPEPHSLLNNARDGLIRLWNEVY
jgi:sugar phosphate isomerase/epimerase